MIETPAAWPVGPLLPVKRPRAIGLPSLGFLKAEEIRQGKIIIHEGLIFMPEASRGQQEFKSVEDLLNAGWVVD